MDNEANEAGELKTRSIRAAAGTFDALKKITETAGFENQGSALTALVTLWEEQNAKKVLPEQGQTIDEVRSHLQALSNIFLTQLDSIANTANRVRGDYQAQLEAQELTIRELRQQLAEALKLAEASQKLSEALEESQADCRRLREQAKKKAEEEAALSATIKALTEVNNSQKTKLAELSGQIAHIRELEQKASALEEEKQRAEQNFAHKLEMAALEKEKAVLAEQAKAQADLRTMQEEFLARFAKQHDIMP